jgi:hypothetical protein
MNSSPAILQFYCHRYWFDGLGRRPPRSGQQPYLTVFLNVLVSRSQRSGVGN